MKKGDYFLDVSGWQVSDLTEICKQAGTSNTIIKTTESTTYFNTSAPQQVATSNCIGFYHFARFGGNLTLAKKEVEYFLSTLPTRNVNYLVCDYEDNASPDKNANTQAILYFMRECKKAGFTPLYYSYKPYTVTNVNVDEILKEFPNSLWLAAYMDYQVRPTPDGIWDIFPSMEGVRFWQFTSTALQGGLDKNIVLLDDETTSNNNLQNLTNIQEENENMKDYVVRSASGKQGYVAIIQGIPFGVRNMSTVHAFKGAGAIELNLEDDDFNAFIHSRNDNAELVAKAIKEATPIAELTK